MKTKMILLLASLLIGGASVGLANDSVNSSVRFHEPEKYTDFRMSSVGTSKDVSYLQKQFRKEIERLATRHLPPGYRLNIVFSDITMAGDFEPQRGPDFDDVRIVKDIYPPRIELSYEIVDENGNVIQQGEKKLTDMGFLHKTVRPGDKTLQHEFSLLADFVRKVGNSIT